MNLNQSIVADPALAWFAECRVAPTITRPLTLAAGDESDPLREAMRRLTRPSPRRRGQLFGIIESFDLKGAPHEERQTHCRRSQEKNDGVFV